MKKLDYLVAVLIPILLVSCASDRGGVLGHCTFTCTPHLSLTKTAGLKSMEIGGVVWNVKVLRSSRIEDPITLQLEIDREKHPHTKGSMAKWKKLPAYSTQDIANALARTFEVDSSSITVIRGGDTQFRVTRMGSGIDRTSRFT